MIRCRVTTHSVRVSQSGDNVANHCSYLSYRGAITPQLKALRGTRCRLLRNNGNVGMVYCAIALATAGFVVGGAFRFRVLLALVGALLLLSVVFSLVHRFSFLETALTILVAQTIFQGAYFVGLVARSFFYRTDEGRGPTLRPPRDRPGERSNFKVSDIPSRIRRWRRRYAQGTEQHPSPFRRQ